MAKIELMEAVMKEYMALPECERRYIEGQAMGFQRGLEHAKRQIEKEQKEKQPA